MQTVQEIARDIVRREGGYVNDPDDPGGATNYGVTIHTMRRLGLDLNNDGRITPADVKRLTRSQAEEIFVDHYFRGPKIDASARTFAIQRFRHVCERRLERRADSAKSTERYGL